MTTTRPKRGEIWWAMSGAKLRPVLVVSADSMNRRLSKALVLPGTTNLRGWPDEVLLQPGVLSEPTAFCCREVTPVPIADLVNRAGSVPDRWVSDVCTTLARVFDCTPGAGGSV